MRFFVSPGDISGNLAKLGAADAEHIRSLRLRPSERFTVCDGECTDYVCRLYQKPGENAQIGGNDRGNNDRGSNDQGGGSVAEILETSPSAGEPAVSCMVYMAYAQGERLDFAVQKSVELGARGVVLFPSRRCEAVPRDVAKRLARLNRIALEAAKQCGRGIVPGVEAAGSFDEAVDWAVQFGRPLFFYEGEQELHLKQALESVGPTPGDCRFSIMTGPVGGFEPSEVEFAVSSGMAAVTLGPRILRCETAPMAALAAIMYHTGNL
jgi:16S rRNA (uracil1498-N3)-methyltransferase